jgi:hypothetical protein
MSTKTLGWLVGARDGKKLGSCWDPVNSIPTLSQPGPFQTFARNRAIADLRYWKEDSSSPSTLIFAATKG